MFGQFIPKNGFPPPEGAHKFLSLKSMKTERLSKEREEEIKKQDDTV